MVNIQVKVNCFSCHELVPKIRTRKVNPFGTGAVYECSACYKNNSAAIIRREIERKTTVKQSLFCNSCRYKFKSKKAVCPYCGSSESLSPSKISMGDLIR